MALYNVNIMSFYLCLCLFYTPAARSSGWTVIWTHIDTSQLWGRMDFLWEQRWENLPCVSALASKLNWHLWHMPCRGFSQGQLPWSNTPKCQGWNFFGLCIVALTPMNTQMQSLKWCGIAYICGCLPENDPCLQVLHRMKSASIRGVMVPVCSCFVG